MLLAFCVLFALRLFAQIGEFERIKWIPQQTSVIVDGQIYKKELKENSCIYYLKKVRISTDDCRKDVSATVRVSKVCVRATDDTYPIGNHISFQTTHRWMDKRRNTGAFDERQYYHSLGIASYYYLQDSPLIISEGPRPVRNGLFYLRKQIRQVYIQTLNEKDAGILASMVLGDKSLMEDEMKSLYSSAGISHILAVSGLHVSMIGMTVFRLLRKSGRKYPVSCIASGASLFLFCLMSGMSISALRACIMFLLFLGAQLLGRKYQTIRGLLIAAGITLLWNPFAIVNAAFCLSYLAVFGAVGLSTVFPDIKSKKKEDRIIKRGWKTAIESVRMSSSILVATIPVTAYFFYEVPIYSVAANLLILPLAGVVMGFGLAGGVLGLTGLPGMWNCLIPCHAVLRFYELVCRAIQMLPCESVITGQPMVWQVILYYVILCAACWLFGKKRIKKKHFWCWILIAMIFVLVPAGGRSFQVSFLDVGQGDGIYITAGDGKHFFIDGGSTSEDQVGKYQILPFLKQRGVRRIDGWIVTHADQDHISGLMELLEQGYPVKTLFLSENIVQDQECKRLCETAKAHGVQILWVSDGDSIHGQNYMFRFYGPESSEDKNEASLVTLLKYKEASFLFTGDIGTEQEEWLLTKLDCTTVTVLKSAHHGSKYSNGQVFLDTLLPQLVVISAGENNPYGHPHREALQRIAQTGSRYVMTMESGEITITKQRGTWWIREMLR